MTPHDAVRALVLLYPKGDLKCEQDENECRIVVDGRVVATGRDWSAAIAAARQSSPEQTRLL